MITLYSGTPGSGKSLHLAQRIWNRMSVKGVMVGNFQINTEKIRKVRQQYLYIDNADLTPDKLINFSRNYSAYLGRRLKEEEILLVIDECQIIFNARDWGQKNRSEWLSFFTQHRKLGYEIILIAQFDRMIDRQIRSLIEYEYIHRKVANFGRMGKALSILTGGGLFVSVKVWYPMKEKVGSEFFRYRKKLGTLYDTYAIFNRADC